MKKEIICIYYEVICLGSDDCEGKYVSEHVIARKKTRKEANAYLKKWQEHKQKALEEGKWYGGYGYIYRNYTPVVRKATIIDFELKI